MKKRVFSLVTVVMLIVMTLPAASPPAAAQSGGWPTVWTGLATDDNGSCNTFRNVADMDDDGYALYYAVDSQYIYLRMETVTAPGWPSTESQGVARYKWWFNTAGTAAYVSGTSVYKAEFLLILEDRTDTSNVDGSRDQMGELTLMDDLENIGFAKRWNKGNSGAYLTGTPDNGGSSSLWKRALGTGTAGTGGPQDVMAADIGYRIDNTTTDGNFVDMYVSWAALGNPSSLCLIWATDNQNPNLDQAPDCDRPTGANCIMLGKDFGDAPAPYPTLMTNDGARHAVGDIYLGAAIDAELDGQPDSSATGDDNNNLDDEDGVVFTTALVKGQSADVAVTASAAGYLDAWVDFNNDGDWADAGERIFNGQSLSAGANNLNFPVPGSAQTAQTFARFRFTSTGGLSYDGLAADGEVEDYRAAVEDRLVLTITADSDSKVYDGTPLTNGGYTITGGALAAGHTLDSVLVTGSQTDVGSSDNVPSAAVILDGAVDVTTNYDITYVNGTLTVTASEIEITADSDSKVYDGTPLTNSGYTITGGALAAGHTLDSVLVTGSQTDVGSSDNVPSAAVILDGAVDVAANYDITYVNGTLTVTKGALEITADSDSKVYDGTPLTNSGYTITGGALAAGHTLDSVVVTGSQTDVGSSDNVPSAAVILDGAVDVAANYDITYVNGTLTVTASEIEITADSDSKVYDGTPLTNGGYTITGGALAAGHTLDSVLVTGSQTDVGSSDNVPSAAVILDGAVDVATNYDITYVNGTLTVTASEIEITADSDSKVYDGTPLTNGGYTITGGALAAGHTLDSVLVTGSQTDVGSSDNVPSAAVILDGAVDVTTNYDITYVNGTLTVTASEIEITADSDSKVYDGTPLTNGGYTITGGALAAGHTLDSVVVTGSQTDVGSSDNVPSAAVILDGAVDVAANYDITYVNGTLTVTKGALEITADSDSKVYDGTPLTNGGYTITGGALAAGHTLDSVVVTGSQTDVGSSDNVPSAAVILDGAVDVAANYDITYVNGTLTVTKGALEITADSDSKVYDGTPLTNSGYTITGGALAAGHTLDSVLVTGSQTDVGSSDNVPSAAVILDGAVDVTTNYDITYVNGTLTVTASEIEITADSDSKVYDGTPLTNGGYTITGGALAAGHTLDWVLVTGSQTDVGSSDNVPSAAVILDGAVDVATNYDITYVNGTLTVTASEIEITADSDSKVYDGTPLTNGGYTITGGALAAGHTLDSVLVTGSQTDVGSSDNVPSAAVILDGAVDVAANYDITYVNGTLTVTKGALEITADSDSKVYDGTPLTNSGYTITGGALAAGHTLDSVLVTGSQTDVGSSDNVPSAAVILDGAVDVAANYDITYVNGTLTVTKGALEITADSDSKVYDGTPLTNSGYTITGGALAAGHTLDSVLVTGSQTDVGSSDNVPSAAVILDGAVDVTTNYDITYVNGTLTVTAREEPEISIVKVASPNSFLAPGTVTYTYTVTNTGNVPLTGINVTDNKLGEITLNVTELNAGNFTTGTASYNVTQTDISAGTPIVNIATARCDQGVCDEATATVTIRQPRRPPGGGGSGGVGCTIFRVDWIELTGDEKITTTCLLDNDRLAEDMLCPNPDGKHNLFLEEGTRVPEVDGVRHYLIVIRELEEEDTPPVPENTVAVAAFNITPAGAVFYEDIFLTLGIEQLPDDAVDADIFYYDEARGVWVALGSEPVDPNGVAELALSAAVDHFTVFAVLVELAPPAPPASFVGSDLTIVPGVEKIWGAVTFVTRTGEDVTITAKVTNEGGQAGTYTVALKINGETVDTKDVTLGAGQSQTVSFSLSGLDYGQYEVEVAGMSDTFTAFRTITWWLILIIVAAIGLIIWGAVWARRRRRARQQA